MTKSKFENTTFHREGVSPRNVALGHTSRSDTTTTKNSSMRTDSKSAFLTGLVETGKPNWKLAPKEIKTRYRGIFLIIFSVPILLLPGWEIFRRVSGRSTKKVQEGEILEGNVIRKFDETEKWTVEKNSLMFKIFGRDMYLDGFTSLSFKENNGDSSNEKH